MSQKSTTCVVTAKPKKREKQKNKSRSGGVEKKEPLSAGWEEKGEKVNMGLEHLCNVSKGKVRGRAPANKPRPEAKALKRESHA